MSGVVLPLIAAPRRRLPKLIAALMVLLPLTACVNDSGPRPVVSRSMEMSPESSEQLMTYAVVDHLLRPAGNDSGAVAAMAILRPMARAQDPGALLIMAKLTALGQQGVQRDLPLAIDYLRQAADLQHPTAMAEYGDLLLRGHDKLTADPVAGLRWIERAVALNHPQGMMRLAETYRDGRVMAADPAMAFAWFQSVLDRARDFETRHRALTGRSEVMTLLLPEQRQAAHAAARAWQPGRAMDWRQADTQMLKHARLYAEAIAAPSLFGNTADQVADIPIRTLHIERNLVIAADGASVLESSYEYKVLNEAGIAMIGTITEEFHAITEQHEVLLAETRKADGRVIPVPKADIMVSPAPRAAESPIFRDMQQVMLVFPQLEVGDTVALKVRLRDKPLIPGHYTMAHPLWPGSLVDQFRMKVQAPRGMPLKLESHGLMVQSRETGGRQEIELSWGNQNPATSLETALSPLDRYPRFFLSTLPDYETLGRFFGGKAAEKEKVTPEIQALADEITAGVTDRRQQAERLYDWVRQRIRYVAVYLGRDGGYISRDAGVVLQTRYGDCKDHVALLAALLNAKGIAHESVLVNATNGYILPVTPVLGGFNHVITWLPEFGVYVDSTAGQAPFGILPFQQYGKPVLHTGPNKAELRRIPPAVPAESRIVSRVAMDAEGRFIGQTESSGDGFLGLMMRQQAFEIQGGGSERSARDAIRQYGFDGTGRFDLGNIQSGAPSYAVTGRFQTLPRREFVSGVPFVPPTLLDIGYRPGNMLLGNLKFPDLYGVEPTPCIAGRQRSELRLTLPPGRRLRELPAGLNIDNAYMRYVSSWRMEGRELVLQRDFEAKPGDPVCIGERRQKAASALNDIRGDYAVTVSLIEE